MVLTVKRPSWLGHFGENDSRQPIYSLDVSNDGIRLATGGLDGKVRIWSVPHCIKAGEGDNDENGLLAAMPAHSGGVLCVKFSPNGRWLASGSDDKLLILWEKDETTSVKTKSFGEKEEVKEIWKVHRRLVGHQNDVVDLAWSYDSSLLVSAGLDSSVVIWSGTTFEKKKELAAHASSVKGLTFDPAGKYFASESDDRTIKVWRINDFACEATISQPFLNSPISTYFRRPSWSPDGDYIAAANSMNGQVHAVAIIDRGTWSSDVTLIGHEAAIEVVKFNPIMFKKEDKDITLIACAGQDRTLSIWITSNPRPIMTMRDIAEQGIGDLSWTPDGRTLFVCSFDGSMTVLTFDHEDFGKALDKEAAEELLNRYGAGRHGAVMPESVEQLRLEELNKKEVIETNQNRIATLMGPVEHPRIGTSDVTSSNAQADTIMGNTTTDIQPSTKTNETPAVVPTPAAPKAYVQKVTMVNGKKRVQPQLLSTDAAQPVSIARPQTQAQISTTQTLEITQPSQALPKGGMPTAIIGNKRPADEEHNEAPLPKRIAEEVPEFLRPAVISPATTSSQIRLGVPQVKSFIQHQRGSEYILEARNAENARDPTKVTLMRGSKIEWVDYLQSSVVLLIGTAFFVAAGCENGGIVVWTLAGRRYMSEIVIEAIPSFLEARDDILMAISSIGLVHVWNLRQKSSPFPPVSLAPILDCATSAIDKVKRSWSISQAGLSARSIPIITLTNGDGYMYHADMHSWLKLTCGWWAITSSFWDASGLAPTNGHKQGIVGTLEHRTNDEVMRLGKGRVLQSIVKQALMKEGYEGFEVSASVAHLENRLAAAVSLQSSEEYHTVLLMFARKIAEENMSGKVEELCRELLGPAHEVSEQVWQASILGHKKRALLQECLAQMGKFRGVQRVCTQYAEELGKITNGTI